MTNKNVSKSRRSRIAIMAEILRNAKKPTNKTRIMFECNLSFDQLKRYLKFLRKKALIRRKISAGSIIYETTNKGQEFLKKYSNMVRLFQLHARTSV